VPAEFCAAAVRSVIAQNKSISNAPRLVRFTTLSFQILPKKKPRETPGPYGSALSREERAASAASEGGLAYGFSADYSGGTAADFHGLPRCPCLQIEN
jgi:hypothetical protein